MNVFVDLLHKDVIQIVLSIGLFILILFTLWTVYHFVLKKLKKVVVKKKYVIDGFMIDLVKYPVLWLLFWIAFTIYTSYSFISQTGVYNTLSKINTVLLILTIGWIFIKVTRGLFHYFQRKLNINDPDNLTARKDLTKMKIFEGIVVAIVVVFTIAICLMSFKEVRTIGVSLLTSAGVMGIVIGFAAQKSIATLLAGMQIAIAQPIRLDDVVVVEGEWGRIEEITLTYVAVKIWDERRLIVPVSYFIEKTFQNWTKNTSNILGSVFLYTDYTIPVEALRNQLLVFVKNHPKWDGRVANIQVTDSKERYIELRILLSSADSSFNWDLRVDIREMMITFINKEYPDCFVKTRIDYISLPNE